MFKSDGNWSQTICRKWNNKSKYTTIRGGRGWEGEREISSFQVSVQVFLFSVYFDPKLFASNGHFGLITAYSSKQTFIVVWSVRFFYLRKRNHSNLSNIDDFSIKKIHFKASGALKWFLSFECICRNRKSKQRNCVTRKRTLKMVCSTQNETI